MLRKTIWLALAASVLLAFTSCSGSFIDPGALEVMDGNGTGTGSVGGGWDWDWDDDDDWDWDDDWDFDWDDLLGIGSLPPASGS